MSPSTRAGSARRAKARAWPTEWIGMGFDRMAFSISVEERGVPLESGLARLGLPADPPFPLRSQQDGLEPTKQAGSGLHLAAVRPPGRAPQPLASHSG